MKLYEKEEFQILVNDENISLPLFVPLAKKVSSYSPPFFTANTEHFQKTTFFFCEVFQKPISRFL